MPERVASRCGGVYRTLLHKYYVDELYHAAVVRPIRQGAEFLWQVCDVKGVDGGVNGIAGLALWTGGVIRKLQAGYIQGYAFSLMLGVVTVLGYLLFR